MKLTEELKEQAKSADAKVAQDAKDCLAIAEKLKEINGDDYIWSSQWRVLTDVRWNGKYPHYTKRYSPSKIGEVFLKGIK
jgi:hypothetical protein